MNAAALVGLVRSRLAYIRDWPDCVVAPTEGEGLESPERVFDLSGLLVGERADDEVSIDYETVGRNLPFPCFAVTGNAEGVVIVVGDERGLYAYAHKAAVPLVIVEFTPEGWTYFGMTRENGNAPTRVEGGDENVRGFVEGAAMLLTLVDRVCSDTRHLVSYRLNRAERRQSVRDAHGVPGSLDNTLIHQVVLDANARAALIERRGDTFVVTPKRLHEVRAHWRHLASGSVVRVRAHRRGDEGSLGSRVYTLRSRSVGVAASPAADDEEPSR